MRRTLIVAAIAAAAVAAQPGAAFGQTYSANGSYTTADGNRLNQGVNARVLHADGATATVSLECFVNTSPPAVATGISHCHMVGATDGKTYNAADVGANPGPSSVRAGLFHGVRNQRYRVCVKSQGFWREGVNWFDAPLVCST